MHVLAADVDGKLNLYYRGSNPVATASSTTAINTAPLLLLVLLLPALHLSLTIPTGAAVECNSTKSSWGAAAAKAATTPIITGSYHKVCGSPRHMAIIITCLSGSNCTIYLGIIATAGPTAICSAARYKGGRRHQFYPGGKYDYQ